MKSNSKSQYLKKFSTEDKDNDFKFAKFAQTQPQKNKQIFNQSFKSEFLITIYNLERRTKGLHRFINAQDTKGYSPLHIAVINLNFDMVITLVNIGAILFIEDKEKKVKPVFFLSSFRCQSTTQP